MFLKKVSICLSFLVIMFFSFSGDGFALVYDDFDNQDLTNLLWQAVDPNEISTYNEIDGVVEIDAPPISSWFNAGSTYYFSGDFDVRLHYQDWALDAVLGGYSNLPQIGFQVSPLGLENTFIYIFRGWVPDGSGDIYLANGRYGGPFDSGASVSTTDTEGWMRIVRTDDDFVTYYSSNGVIWNVLYSANDKFTEDILIQGGAFTGDTTNSFHAEFEKVEVTSEGMGAVAEPTTLVLLNCGLCVFLIRKNKSLCSAKKT